MMIQKMICPSSILNLSYNNIRERHFNFIPRKLIYEKRFNAFGTL